MMCSCLSATTPVSLSPFRPVKLTFFTHARLPLPHPAFWQQQLQVLRGLNLPFGSPRPLSDHQSQASVALPLFIPHPFEKHPDLITSWRILNAKLPFHCIHTIEDCHQIVHHVLGLEITMQVRRTQVVAMSNEANRVHFHVCIAHEIPNILARVSTFVPMRCVVI
jgi:hypothetical protein